MNCYQILVDYKCFLDNHMFALNIRIVGFYPCYLATSMTQVGASLVESRIRYCKRPGLVAVLFLRGISVIVGGIKKFIPCYHHFPFVIFLIFNGLLCSLYPQNRQLVYLGVPNNMLKDLFIYQ